MVIFTAGLLPVSGMQTRQGRVQENGAKFTPDHNNIYCSWQKDII
jgi:hypothetical protein